jgi:anti-sigma-K factor RskA
MNLHRYPQLVDLLAAEYALGTLRGGARRRLRQYAEHDVVIRRSLEEWQHRLEPMAELVPARMPSPAVWEAIERRLGLAAARSAAPRQPAASARPARNWFDNLAFWRGWAIGVTALAAWSSRCVRCCRSARARLPLRRRSRNKPAPRCRMSPC